MKRVSHIFEKIVTEENISLAIDKASLGKRNQRQVKKILEHKDVYIKMIQELLINGNYCPMDPTMLQLRDSRQGKDRVIFKPRFYPDQIVQWALMLQLQPVITKGMYGYCIGSIPNRGIRKGQVTIQKWMKEKTKYCLKMDIRKFYPSVDKEILKQKFRKKLKDKRTLDLIDLIIDCNEIGLPIGFYTSQWFANFYLQDLDHYIKETLHAPFYIRYVDDIVILGPNKRKLHRIRKGIDAYLNKEHLTVKDNWQVFPIGYYGKPKGRPIDFLGYKFYKDKTTLRKRNALRWSRRLRRIKKKGYLTLSDAYALNSYKGFMKRTNSYNFYQKYYRSITVPRIVKKLVSKNDRANNRGDPGYIFDLAERRYKRK